MTDELIRLENALRESDERFRATFEEAAVGLAHMTTDGRWIRANQRLTEILGYSREELLAQTLQEVTHPEDFAREQALTAQLVAGELPWFSVEKRYVRKDGSTIWVDRTVSAVREDGAVKYLISIVHDATERKAAEQRSIVPWSVSRALAHSADRFEDMSHVLKVVGELLEWEVGVYWLIDRETNALRMQCIWRTSTDKTSIFEKGTRDLTFAKGIGLPGKVWAAEAPVWVADVTADPSLPRTKLYAASGMHGAVAFPIRGPVEVLGVMEFFTSAVRVPDEALLQTLGGVGDQVGQFIERRRVQTTIRESEATHTAILESALDAIVTIDHRGTITEFNAAAERTFGYRRKDVIGRNMGEVIVPPNLRDAHRRGMERYLASGEKRVIDQRIEIMAMRADQTEFPVELAITRLPVEGPPRFTGYMRDLTERKRAEANHDFLLKASEVLSSSLDYMTTLRSVADLAVPAVADWCAIDMRTPRGETARLAVKHIDPAKLELVKLLDEHYPPDPHAATGVPQVLRSGVAEYMEEIPTELLEQAAQDGEHLKLIRELGLKSYICVPLSTRSGVIGVITLVTAESGRRYGPAELELAKDLARRAATAVDNSRLFQETLESQLRLEEQATEMEAQAAELERAKAQLESANESLRLANDDLVVKTAEAEAARAVADEANKAKSAFLATMSHELRTPLNAIGGYAQLLEEGIRGPISPEQREDLRRIRRSQTHLTRLVNDVLNFAKLDMGRVQLRIEDVLVNDVLEEIDSLIRPQIREKKLQYVFVPRGMNAVACADRERLMQVVLNLLTNAIKFTPPGGTITVDWDIVGKTVAIRVHDTGRGIPSDKLDAIFEPFLQLDRKLTREADGVGLGLAISRDLARAMRGDLTVTSSYGEGSTFELTLPLSTRKATPFRSMEAVPGQKLERDRS